MSSFTQSLPQNKLVRGVKTIICTQRHQLLSCMVSVPLGMPYTEGIYLEETWYMHVLEQNTSQESMSENIFLVYH